MNISTLGFYRLSLLPSFLKIMVVYENYLVSVSNVLTVLISLHETSALSRPSYSVKLSSTKSLALQRRSPGPG